MGKISNNIVKSSFSKNNITAYKLSILCGIDSLYYCVTDKSNEVLVLKQFDLFAPITLNEAGFYRTKFNEIWEKDTIIPLPFPIVHVAFIHPHYTIIPNRLFQESNKATYLMPLKQASESPELYQASALQTIDAQLVFSLPQTAIEFFESKYGDAKIRYANSFVPLIEGVGKQMQRLSGKHVWVNIHPNTLQLVVFDNNALIFSNQFNFQTDKDFLYYIMLVYSQFKLDPEVIPLHITGQLVRESAIYKKLYRYIRFLSFFEIPAKYKLTENLSEQPNHFYFDLLSVGIL